AGVFNFAKPVNLDLVPAPLYNVLENDGTATIIVTRTGGAAGQVTVDYAVTSGSALAGTDFTAVSGRLTFAANETSKTFSVPILIDSASNEGLETANLALSNPTGG